MTKSPKKPVTYDVIPFAREFNHISPLDLDDIMESLKDSGFLSSEGIKFKSAFYKLFICKK